MKNKEEIRKKVEEISKRYYHNMQLEMQRFANKVMELKFEVEE